jgi:hypothetical protein
VLRTSAVGLVIACAFGAAPVALGQQGTTSYPQELWKAYPLEQRPATQAPPPADEQPVVTTADDGSGGPLWWWVVVATAAGGILVVALVSLARRRRTRAAGVDLQPARWPAPAPTPPARPRPARAPRAPTRSCQVRWSRSGGCFVAVAIELDGTERGIARSPSVDWSGPEPPDHEPEFEAALKVLSKQLRDLGWRPLRARGFDFDERRWYARRFRWPTEAEAEQPADVTTPRRRVGMHANEGDR